MAVPHRSSRVAEMSMAEFKHLVTSVMETLPEEIRSQTDNVVVEVVEWPDDNLLRKAGLTEEEIEDGETLLGLFEPFEWLSDPVDFPDEPHKLWIFKGPHEEEYEDPKRLRTEIRKTVIHELAHHFGWTDRDLERFDSRADPFGENRS
jgi:predicted Zn-dependent protease with MMP-like domain